MSDLGLKNSTSVLHYEPKWCGQELSTFFAHITFMIYPLFSCCVTFYMQILIFYRVDTGGSDAIVRCGRTLHTRNLTFNYAFQLVIEPENWPANSPGLNPVDYSVWGVATDDVSSQNFALTS